MPEEKDWGAEPFDVDTETRKCSRCGAVNEVSSSEGPQHGDWNEEFAIRCAKCKEPLGAVKAFGPPTVRVIKQQKR